MISELVDAILLVNADVIVKHHHHQENATKLITKAIVYTNTKVLIQVTSMTQKDR